MCVVISTFVDGMYTATRFEFEAFSCSDWDWVYSIMCETSGKFPWSNTQQYNVPLSISSNGKPSGSSEELNTHIMGDMNFPLAQFSKFSVGSVFPVTTS